DAHRRGLHPGEHPRGELEAGGPRGRPRNGRADGRDAAVLRRAARRPACRPRSADRRAGIDRARQDRARDRRRSRHAEGRRRRDRTVGAGGQERHPVRLEDRLQRRVTSLPRPILVGIAAAWAAAIGAQVAGVAALANHDSLLTGDRPPFLAAALIALLAWQVMIAAMMLPSSLPLVRMYSRATADAPQRGRSMVAFIGGYALMWSAFGLAAFCFDASIHAAVNSSSWLEHHDWWIGGSVLALAGAFQFTALK